MDLIKKAIFDYIGILRMLKKTEYWGYILIIAMITSALAIGAFYLAYKSGAYIADSLADAYPFKFGRKAADTFLHLVPFTYIIAVTVVKYFIFIAVSPFLNKISRKMEHAESLDLNHIAVSTSKLHPFLDVIKISGRAFYKEILWTLLFSFIGLLVPVAGLIGFFIVQSYYIGSCYIQLVLLRKKQLEELVPWTKMNRGIALGNGAVYLTILLIPFLGLLLSSPLAIFAATKSVFELERG